jgi:hypothetical protein
MMRGDRQQRTVMVATEQRGANEHAAVEFEGRGGILQRGLDKVVVVGVDEPQRQLPFAFDDLEALGFVGTNTRTKYRMPRNDRIQCRFDKACIDAPLHVQQQRNVVVNRTGFVKAARFERIDEPHALLVIGQRMGNAIRNLTRSQIAHLRERERLFERAVHQHVVDATARIRRNGLQQPREARRHAFDGGRVE